MVLEQVVIPALEFVSGRQFRNGWQRRKIDIHPIALDVTLTSGGAHHRRIHIDRQQRVVSRRPRRISGRHRCNPPADRHSSAYWIVRKPSERAKKDATCEAPRLTSRRLARRASEVRAIPLAQTLCTHSFGATHADITIYKVCASDPLWHTPPGAGVTTHHSLMLYRQAWRRLAVPSRISADGALVKSATFFRTSWFCTRLAEIGSGSVAFSQQVGLPLVLCVE